MSDIGNYLSDIYQTLAEMQRQMAGMVSRGTVHEVDAEAGTVRLKLGEGSDGEPFLSPPVPYAQFMGALKVHTPPSVGQQMTAFAAAGDFRQGLAVPMTQSDANKSPSTKDDENVATYGGFRLKLDGEHLTVTNGGVSFDISGGGIAIKADVTIEGAFDVTGDSFTHNGKNVGDDHAHTGVMPGASNTGPPA